MQPRSVPFGLSTSQRLFSARRIQTGGRTADEIPALPLPSAFPRSLFLRISEQGCLSPGEAVSLMR